MLTIKQLRDDREAAIRRLAKKGVDAAPVIAEIEKLDDRRKAIQHELDECLATQNQAAKQIGALMGQGPVSYTHLHRKYAGNRDSGSGAVSAGSIPGDRTRHRLRTRSHRKVRTP